MKEAQYTRNDRREHIIARNRARRRRELQNRMIVAGVTLCLVILFSLFLGSFLSEAKEKCSGEDVKRFKSVMIMYDETLDDIAEANFNKKAYASIDDYTDEIIRINSLLGSESVRPGQCIVIPYYCPVD